jgi:hypothetical protein
MSPGERRRAIRAVVSGALLGLVLAVLAPRDRVDR